MIHIYEHTKEIIKRPLPRNKSHIRELNLNGASPLKLHQGI